MQFIAPFLELNYNTNLFQVPLSSTREVYLRAIRWPEYEFAEVTVSTGDATRRIPTEKKSISLMINGKEHRYSVLLLLLPVEVSTIRVHAWNCALQVVYNTSPCEFYDLPLPSFERDQMCILSFDEQPESFSADEGLV